MHKYKVFVIVYIPSELILRIFDIEEMAEIAVDQMVQIKKYRLHELRIDELSLSISTKEQG